MEVRALHNVQPIFVSRLRFGAVEDIKIYRNSNRTPFEQYLEQVMASFGL